MNDCDRNATTALLPRRCVIYAAYSRDGKINISDELYLQSLTKVAQTIILVADNCYDKSEILKIKQYTDHVIAKPHGEYDFGSYKRGFNYCKEQGILQNIDELIMCNDSCFAPLNDFISVFNKMQNEVCDFWGITENKEFAYHIQSFFLVFRPQVFNSEVFFEFMQSITKQKNVQDIIKKYEIGLTQTLLQSGYKALPYISYPNTNQYPFSIVKGFKNLTAVPIWCIKKGSPIVKKKAFLLIDANYEGFINLWLFCIYKNYKLFRAIPSLKSCLLLDLSRYKNFFARFCYQRKITKSGKLLIKICKIPVYYKQVQVTRGKK